MLRIWLAALLLVNACAVQGQSQPAQRWFIVHLTFGANWDKGKPPQQQPGFAEHSANLKTLRDSGRLPLGARYADKGLLVVRAADAAEARALFDADPMVAQNLFALQIDELRVFYAGTVGEPAAGRPPPAPPATPPAPPPPPAR